MNVEQVVQLLIKFGILQGLVLALLLLFSKRHRKVSNFFLSLFLLTYSFKLLLNSNIDLGIGLGYYLVSILLISPFYYLYVVSIIKPNFQFRFSQLWHFIPALSYLITIRIGHAYHGGLTYQSIFEDKVLLIITSCLQAGVALQTVLYQVVILHKLKLQYRLQKNKTPSLPYNQLVWLSLLAASFGLVLVIWLFLGYADIAYFTSLYGPPSMSIAYLFWAWMSITVLGIGYYGLVRPEIFIDNFKNETSRSSQRKSMIKDLSYHVASLLKVMKTEKPYLNPKLKLSQLSELMSWNPGLLSVVINEGTGKNFNDFINEYRVNEFIQRMNSGKYEGLTLIAIAYDAGFNSKSTFNAVFKKITGSTPRQYRDHQILAANSPGN